MCEGVLHTNSIWRILRVSFLVELEAKKEALLYTNVLDLDCV